MSTDACCSGYYVGFSGPWCDNSDCSPEECKRRQAEDDEEEDPCA
jgi:hypothetical protein